MATKTKTKPAAAPLLDGVIIEQKPRKPAKGAKPAKPSREVVVAKPQVQRLPARRVPAEPKSMLALIAGAASDPRVDVGKMQALLNMQKELEEREAAKAFNIAMLAAQSEMPRIVRDKQADRFKYATLEKVSREVDPIYRKHGFVLSYGHREDAGLGMIAVFADVMHETGCTRRYFCPEMKPETSGLKGGANKTDNQGAGSSISYQRRYLKVMIFDIAISGEDNDGGKRKPLVECITAEEAGRLTDLCEAEGCPRDRVLQNYGIETFSDLPAKDFKDVVKRIQNYGATLRAGTKGGDDARAES